MDKQAQFKLFSFFLQIQRTIKRYQIIRYSIKILQCIWILVFIITSLKTGIFSSYQFWNQATTFVISYLMNEQLLQAIFWIEILFCLIIILAAFMCIKYFQEPFSLPKHRKKQKVAIIIASLSFWISEILIYPAVYGIGKNSGETITQMILKSIIIGFLYFCSVGSISKFSLYKKWTLILGIVLWNHNTNLLRLFVSFAIVLYEFIRNQQKLTRVLSSVILVSCSSGIFDELFRQILSLDQFLASLYTQMLMVLLMVYILKFGSFFSIHQEINSFESVLERISQIKLNQNLKDKLSLKQIIHINNFVLLKANKLHKQLYENLSNRISLDSSIRSVYQDTEQILLQIIQNSSSLLYKLLIIECMIATGKTLSCIYSFINLHEIDIDKIPFQFKLKYIQIIQKLKNSYGMFKSDGKEQLQVSAVQQIDRVVNQFRDDTQQIMIKQIQFWEAFLQNEINTNQVYQSYEQLQLLRRKIKKNKKILLKFNLFHRFRFIYKSCEKSFRQYDDEVNQNDEEIQNEQEDIFKPWQKQSSSLDQNQKLSDKFFVVSDAKVIKISHSLVTQIKIKQYDFQFVEIQSFLGEYTSDYLMDKINYMGSNNQNSWFQLPFFVSKYKFIAFKAKILWIPTLDGTGTYLIQLVSVPNTSFLYYSIQTDNICYFSDHFIKEFGICEDIVNLLIDTRQLKYEKVFLYSFNSSFSNSTCQMSKKYKEREKSYVPLQMRLSNLLEQDQQSHTRNKVFGKGYDYICMGDQMFTILQIKSFKFQSMRTIGNLSTGTFFVISPEQTSLISTHQKQKFFCKLPNSYPGKITQKLASLSSLWIMKGWMWLWLISGIFFSFWIAENVYSYHGHNKNNMLYERVRKSLSENYQQNIILLDLYSTSSKVYHALKYPQNIFFEQDNTFKGYIQDQKQYQQKKLKHFLSIYLQSINSNHYHKMPYEVDFDSFEVSALTGTTGLMDFASAFKKNIDQNQWDFLLANYPKFRRLTDQFETTIDYKTQIQQSISHAVTMGALYLCAIALLFFFIIIVSCKNDDQIQKVISLYAQMQNKEIQCKISQLKKDLSTYFSTETHRYSSSTPKQQSNNNVVNRVVTLKRLNFGQKEPFLQKDSFLDRLNMAKNTRKKKYRTLILGSSVKHVTQKQMIPAKQQPKKQVIVKKHKKMVQSWIKSHKKYLYPIIVIGISYSFLIGDMISLKDQQSRFSKLLDLQKLIFDSKMNLHQIISDTELSPVYLDYYGTRLPAQNISSIKINVRFETDSTSPQLTKIQKHLNSFLQSDLCINSFESQKLPQLDRCRIVADGTLTRGYSESFLYISEMSQKIQDRKLQQLTISKCKLQHCPLNEKFVYVTQLLSLTVTKAIQTFNNEFVLLNQANLRRRYKELMIKGAIGVILMVGFTIYAKKYQKKGQKTLKLFKYFPKFIANSMRISKVLRNQSILQALQKI